jgi:hypothetical protein
MKRILLATAILSLSFSAFAQDELLNLMNEGNGKQKKDFAIATFKTTRLFNFHTIETQSKRTLDFRISHRFSDMTLKDPATLGQTAFGLDGAASIKLSLEYCFDGRFQIGVARCNDQKMASGFAKYRLLRQTTNKGNPISITLFSGVYHSFVQTGDDYFAKALDRLSFCNQIMIARKFNRRFSLQLGGVMVHYNVVPYATDKNDLYFATVVTRFKLTNRMAITAEYAYGLNNNNGMPSASAGPNAPYAPAAIVNGKSVPYFNSASIGVDIETGGHVFQIGICNSYGLDEPEYYAHTNKDWMATQIRLGFNISRVFDF